jgi:hypothetical protein
MPVRRAERKKKVQWPIDITRLEDRALIGKSLLDQLQRVGSDEVNIGQFDVTGPLLHCEHHLLHQSVVIKTGTRCDEHETRDLI